MADSSAFLAWFRSPPKTPASPSYRSPPAAASANARSPASAASTRGSSCAASATTSTQPGSATTARRSTRGICSAPPPRDAHRPDTTPPTTYSGRNLPSRTQASSQDQPCEACSRDSSLYSSSGGIAGWSISRSTENLVDDTRIPAPASARTSWVGESRFTGRPPSAAEICEPGRAGPGQRGGRPRPEQSREHLVVHVGPPRHPGEAHLGGHQLSGGLGGHQCAEPRRVLAGRDPPQLVRVHRDQPVERRARVRR